MLELFNRGSSRKALDNQRLGDIGRRRHDLQGELKRSLVAFGAPQDGGVGKGRSHCGKMKGIERVPSSLFTRPLDLKSSRTVGCPSRVVVVLVVPSSV